LRRKKKSLSDAQQRWLKLGLESSVSESISLLGLEGCYPAAVKRDLLKVYYGERNMLIVTVTAIA